MSASIYELLLEYSKLGIKHWASQPTFVKNGARKIGVEIASNVATAIQAVASPYVVNTGTSSSFKLIPMPCDQRRVHAAFFAPWVPKMISLDLPNLSFDLVVLTHQGQTIAFRFEPASRFSTSTHKYDHVQLSESLGQKTVQLRNTLTHLPKVYPAFPIPTNDPLTRFLAMAVTMHGFPQQLSKIIESAFMGRASLRRLYTNMASTLVTI